MHILQKALTGNCHESGTDVEKRKMFKSERMKLLQFKRNWQRPHDFFHRTTAHITEQHWPREEVGGSGREKKTKKLSYAEHYQH